MLAAVAIIEAADRGLVDKTMNAAEEYAKAQEKESADMESLHESIKNKELYEDDMTGEGRNR